MLKKGSLLIAVFFLVSSFNFRVSAETPGGCWAAADAAETFTCGSVGCNFDLWDAVYSACMGWPQS